MAREQVPVQLGRSAPTEGRTGGAAAVVDGQLYVVGGTTGSTLQPTLFRYDPAQDAWTAPSDLPGLPVARDRLAAVEAGGRLVVVGGSIAPPGHGSTRVDMYDPATSTWRLATPLPVGRSAAAGVALHDRLYVLGGALPGATLTATGQAHVYSSVLEPTVVVTQVGATAIYGAVTPLTLTYGAASGTRSVTVTATPGDAPWTVESDAPWLTVSPGSGVGSKTVTVTAATYTTPMVPDGDTNLPARGRQYLANGGSDSDRAGGRSLRSVRRSSADHRDAIGLRTGKPLRRQTARNCWRRLR